MKSLTIVLLMFSLQAVMGFGLKDLEEPIKKCTPPKKLEGKFTLSYKAPGTWIGGAGKIHVDYTIGKAMVFRNIIVNSTAHDSSVYTINNTTYIVIPTRKECRKKNFGRLPGTMPAGVPLNITRGVLEGVRVQIWEFKRKKGHETVTYYMTEDKCMFMRITEKGQFHFKYSKVAKYHDMKEGIKDTSVFDLPKFCVKPSYYGVW